MQQKDCQRCGCVPAGSINIELPNCSLYWETGQQPPSDNGQEVEQVMRLLDSRQFAAVVDRTAHPLKLKLSLQSTSKSGECILKLIAPDAVACFDDEGAHQPNCPIDLDCLAAAGNREKIVAVNTIFQHWLLGDGYLQNLTILDGQLKIIDDHYSLRVSTPKEPRADLIVVDEQEYRLEYDPKLVKSEMQAVCRRIHSLDTILKVSDQHAAGDDNPYEQSQMWLIQLLRRTAELIEEQQLDVEPFSAAGVLGRATREELPGLASRLLLLGLINDVQAELPVHGNKTVGELLLQQTFLRILAEDSSLTRRQISFLKNLRIVNQLKDKLLNPQRVCLLLHIIQKASKHSTDGQLACRAFQFLAMCGFANLQNLNLSNLDLPNCDIRGSAFYHCRFSNSNLADCRIDERIAFLECFDLNQSVFRGGAPRPVGLGWLSAHDNLVMGQLDEEIVFYNEGQFLMKCLIRNWNGSTKQLTLPIVIRSKFQIFDMATGRLLQYTHTTDIRQEQVRNGIHYQLISERSTGSSSPHIKKINLVTLETQVFNKGFDKIYPSMGEIEFSDDQLFFRYYRIQNATFCYDMRTGTTTRMPGVRKSLASDDTGWVVENADNKAIFRKQGKILSWNSDQRMLRIQVLCENPLTVAIMFESRNTHIIDVENSRFLFQYKEGTLAIDKSRGSDFSDIKVYHFRATEDCLSEFQQLKLGSQVVKTSSDEHKVATFINKPKFEKVGPIRLLTTPKNSVYYVCGSNCEAHLLLDGQKDEKLIHNIQAKLLGVQTKDSVLLYRIHEQALTLIHTVHASALAKFRSKRHDIEGATTFSSLVLLGWGLALLEFRRHEGYSYSVGQAFAVFDDASMRLVSIPLQGSHFDPISANGLICLRVMENGVYAINEDGMAFSLNGVLDSNFAYSSQIIFDRHRQSLNLQSASYSYDFSNPLELIFMQRSLGFHEWSKATLLSNDALLLQKQQHIYLQQGTNWKKVNSKQHREVLATGFLQRASALYIIRRDEGEVCLEVWRLGEGELQMIDTAILPDFLTKESLYSLMILEGRIVTAHKEGGFLVYDAPSWLPKTFASVRPVKTCVQHLPDILYLLDNLSVVSCLDLRTPAVREVAGRRLHILRMCKTTKNKLCYLNDTDHLHVFDSRTQQLSIFPIPHEEFISQLALTEDTTIACVAYKSTWLVGLELATGNVRFSMRGFYDVRSLQCLDSTLLVFDVSRDAKNATSYLSKMQPQNMEEDYDQFLDPHNLMKLSNSRAFIIDTKRPPKNWTDSRPCSHSFELFLLHEVDQPSSLKLIHQ